jgi:hypothetical protein
MAYDPATPPLIEQWAINIGETQPIAGSWLHAIAKRYGANTTKGDLLSNIAAKLGVDLTKSTGDHYQDIALKLKSTAQSHQGSWLSTIVKLTTPA